MGTSSNGNGRGGNDKQRRRARTRRVVSRTLEHLESRELLTGADPVGISAGDFYYYNDQQIPLQRSVDQLLVRFTPELGEQLIRDLTRPGGILSGFEWQATSDPGVYTVTRTQLVGGTPQQQQVALQAIRNQLMFVQGVTEAAETFIVNYSGRAHIPTSNELYVALEGGVNPANVFTNAQFSGYRRVRGTTNQYVATTRTSSGPATLQLANQLHTNDTRVDYATPNFYLPRSAQVLNDPLLSTQWHLNNTGQGGGTPGADANVFDAWTQGYTGEGAVIAVLDDGVQWDHPDLIANAWLNTGEIAGNGVDDDNNGFVDDIRGWDFFDDDNDARPAQAVDNHGTAVAGVAAARGDNSLGLAGAGYRAQIMPVRVGSAGIPIATEIEGIYYAAGRTADGLGTWNSADIINMSFGGPAPVTAEQEALDWAVANGRGGLGTINIGSSGNDSLATVSFPAAYESVLAVGGSTDGDVRVSYSQFGPELDFVAPTGGLGFNGIENINTTDRTGADGYAAGDYTGTGATGFNGTSSSAPLAAGIAALVLDANPDLTFAEVRDLLRSTSAKIGGVVYDQNGFHIEYGFGRLDAGRAVTAAEVRLRVQSTIPADGASLGTGVTQLVVTFNLPVNPTTLQASDLVFTTRPPGVTVTVGTPQFDPNVPGRVVFPLTITPGPGSTANGLYEYELAESSIASTDGRELAAHLSSFTINDVIAPRVIANTLASRIVTVTFSEPMNPSLVNSSRVQLIRANNPLGAFDNPTNIILTNDPRVSVTFDPVTNTATIDLSLLDQPNLPSDFYAIRVLDTVTDIVGNPLDGEFSGVFPSGNGAGGGVFFNNLGLIDLSAPQIVSFSLTLETDTGIDGDSNTGNNGSTPAPLTFEGRIASAFPGTVAGLTVVVQFAALHGGVFDLTVGPGGIGFVGDFDVETTTDENGQFRFNVPAQLADGFHRVRLVVVGASAEPPLPGLATQFDQGFRVDTTNPVLAANPSSVEPDDRISSLAGGILLDVTDAVLPNSAASPLAVPTGFVVPALDPNLANNVSNYALVNLGQDGALGGGDDSDFSNFITSATFAPGTPRAQVTDPFRGTIALTFAGGLPAGRYALIARTPTSPTNGLTDAAGNGIDGNPAAAGLEDFVLPFDFQPVPAFITDVKAVTPDPNGGPDVLSPPRSFFELPSPGRAPRAAAPPTSFIIDFSNPLPQRDYTEFVQLIRSANQLGGGAIGPFDGDFGVDPTFQTGNQWSRVPNTTVTLTNSVLGAEFGDPGFQNRLTISLPAGTRLAADDYRLYIPNAVRTGGTDLRILDLFGNHVDAEFLGNPTPQGAFETLLPTGQYRAGLTGDLVPGGAFTTGYVVAPNANVIFARPDYIDDPLLSEDDPDGSPQKPYAALAPEADPNNTGLHGGDLNSAVNFGPGFNPGFDRNGNGRFDRSAFFRASQLAANGPVVIIAQPAQNPASTRTFVLQAPAGTNPVINDGSASVPKMTNLVFQPGSILKLRNASLYVQEQGSSLQVKGGPNQNQRVFITSFSDDTVGGDTNGNGSGASTQPQGGDWGGIVLRNFNDETMVGGQRRPVPVSPGPADPVDPRLGLSGADDAMSFFNFADVRFGGGAVPQTIGFRFDAITLFNSRPMIANTIVSRTGGPAGAQAAISADVDSFREDDLARGMLARRVTLISNSINAILVRAELTGVAQPTDAIFYTTNPTSRGGELNFTFDDNVPYVLTSRMEVGTTLRHNTGGATRENTARFYFQPGTLMKFQRGSAIDVINQNASINIGDRTYLNQFDRTPGVAPGAAGFRAAATGDARVVFTSLFDDLATTFFVDPTTGARTTLVPPIDSDNGGPTNQPTPGNVPPLARWGSVSVLSGAIAVIDEAVFQYGGGSVNIAQGTIDQRDVLDFFGAGGFSRFGQTLGALGTRAYVTNNDFFDNREAAISIEPDGLLAADPLRPLQSGNAYFRNNVMQRNDINGMEVIPPIQNRNGTTFFGFVANNSVDSIWDDTDLTYVLRTTIWLDGATFDAPTPNVNDFVAQLRPYMSVTLQSSLPDTLLADGTRVPRPGESLLIKLLTDQTVPIIGDGINGMPTGNTFSDSRAGAGFLVGIDDGVDPPTDPVVDAGMMSQLRILGIGGNETTGQQRVPVIMTSLRDNTVGKTVRGVDMFAATNNAYLATLPGGVPGGPDAGPQPGDWGALVYGANMLSDYNLWDPRDGSLIDNADISFASRIEQQGGGWVYGTGLAAKIGNTPATQFNTAKAMTISNTNLADFSQVGFIAHQGTVNQIDAPLGARNTGNFRGQPTLTYFMNTTFSNMPTGIRLVSETVNNDQSQNPTEAVILNTTFFNIGIGVDTQAPAFNNQNSLSHVHFLVMNSIFANITTAGVRVAGQGTLSQLQYNVFSNVPTETILGGATPPAEFVAFPFNAQPVRGTALFRDPANGDFSLMAGSAGIDSARSEIGPLNLGVSLQPIVTQQLDATGGIRRPTGRTNPFGGLGFGGSPGDIITLPGLPQNLRGFFDQWVPAIPGSPGAIPGPSSNPGNAFSYIPILGERDQAGFQRLDDTSQADLGFGSRPYFDIGAYEFRPLTPPKVTDVVAAIVDPGTGNPVALPIYVVGGVGGSNQTPQAIVVSFDRRLDPATITNMTVILQASGGDGIFGNGNSSQDRSFDLSGKLVYDTATQRLFILLAQSNLNLQSDLYRVTLLGVGGQVIRDEAGTPLDGENTEGGSPTGAHLPLPSGDNIPGGNFFLTFSVDTNPPVVVGSTLRLVTDTNRPTDSITRDPRPFFTGRISDIPPPLNPLLGQTVILDFDANGDGVFELLDIGRATTDATGVFSIQPTNALPNSSPNAGPDGLLGTSDDTNYSLARVRVIDQSGNVSNPNDPNARVRVVIDTVGPTVTGASPLPGETIVPSTGIVPVSMNFSETIDRTSLDATTIQVVRAGADGMFGTADDAAIQIDPASIFLTPLGSPTGAVNLRFNIIGVAVSDVYQITLEGTAARSVIDIAGNPLDGEFAGAFPSGDGTPGGDFTLRFIVLAPTSRRILYVSATGSAAGDGRRANPFQTVTQGLAAALPGDTVAVIGGTASSAPVLYVESITLKSLVQLVSADPRSTDAAVIPGIAQKTVIMAPFLGGAATTTVVATDLVSAAGFRTLFQGFTVLSPTSTGGTTGSIVDGSIGINSSNSDLDISKNIFLGAAEAARVTISGGAAATPRLLSNLFDGNLNAVVIADFGTTGFLNSRSVHVFNNTFAYNTNGVAIASAAPGGPILSEIANNIFFQTATRGVRSGSAIIANTDNRGVLRANLFSGNGPNAASGADDVIGVFPGFNNLTLNTRPDAFGNFVGDPAFLRPIDARPNAAGVGNFLLGANFDLAQRSKAIDVALNSLAPTTDLLHRTRVNIPNVSRLGFGPADIGAYEFRGVSTIPTARRGRPRTGAFANRGLSNR